MRAHRRKPMRRTLALALLFAGCAGGPSNTTDDNAFLDGERAVDGKEDTGYQTSLKGGSEVEVDLEGDVVASSWEIDRAPLEVGQFALTYLRQHNDVYLQSMAEDYAHGTDKIEWLVGGKWVSIDAPGVSRSQLSHFRMRGISTVVLNAAGSLAGKKWSPIVPKKPGSLFADVGTSCGDPEGEIPVEQDVYWYVWNPDKSGCKAQTQPLSVAVSKVLPVGGTTYPEYDRLIADKKIDVLVLFGQVDHGSLSSSDYSFTEIRTFESSIKRAGFVKSATAPRGLRYTRTRSGITTTIDIYSPREFAGLDDTAHIKNFDDGINSHELIVYNGHSMLGASDFWARPSIYASTATKYQIFLYNGCLGYEYYVNPILEGKQSWANVDLVSNVIETPFSIMVQESATAISMIATAAERGGITSWQSILGKMNDISGSDSFYGASGIRDNKFKPAR
jgi:hypothetical protein